MIIFWAKLIRYTFNFFSFSYFFQGLRCHFCREAQSTSVCIPSSPFALCHHISAYIIVCSATKLKLQLTHRGMCAASYILSSVNILNLTVLILSPWALLGFFCKTPGEPIVLPTFIFYFLRSFQLQPRLPISAIVIFSLFLQAFRFVAEIWVASEILRPLFPVSQFGQWVEFINFTTLNSHFFAWCWLPSTDSVCFCLLHKIASCYLTTAQLKDVCHFHSLVGCILSSSFQFLFHIFLVTPPLLLWPFHKIFIFQYILWFLGWAFVQDLWYFFINFSFACWAGLCSIYKLHHFLPPLLLPPRPPPYHWEFYDATSSSSPKFDSNRWFRSILVLWIQAVFFLLLSCRNQVNLPDPAFY